MLYNKSDFFLIMTNKAHRGVSNREVPPLIKIYINSLLFFQTNQLANICAQDVFRERNYYCEFLIEEA